MEDKQASNIRRLKGIIVKLNEKCDQLKTENAYLTSQLGVADTGLAEANSERDEVTAKCDELSSKVDRLVSDLQASKEASTAAQAKAAELEAEFERYKEQTNTLLEDLQSQPAHADPIAEDSTEPLAQQLDDALQDAAAARAAEAQLSRERQLLGVELTECHDRVLALRRELAQARVGQRETAARLAEEKAQRVADVQRLTAPVPAMPTISHTRTQSEPPEPQTSADKTRLDALTGELAELREVHAKATEQLAFFKEGARHESADEVRVKHLRSSVMALLTGADRGTMLPVLGKLLDMTPAELDKVQKFAG